ncbi:MAG: ankyrin repeat domain-containing protein [Pyrinomonadaceae bacterium]
MRQTKVLCGAVMLLLAFIGCAADRTPTARSPETDALMRAARGGHADTIKNLLASPGADVNAKGERGDTALMEAARFGHDDAVRALLVAQSDVRARNEDGKTALMLAAEGGHTQTVQLLKQAGAAE